MVLAIGSKLADIDTNLLPLTNIYLHIISQCRLLMFSRSRECKTGYGAAGECGAQIRTWDSKTEVSKSSRREQTSSSSQRQYCESSPLLPLLPPSSTSPFLINCSYIHMHLTVLEGNPLSSRVSLERFNSLYTCINFPSPHHLQQAQAEQEEEFISNTLLKKIHSLKKEKEALAMNYEQEEEFLTNDLSRKLAQVIRL